MVLGSFATNLSYQKSLYYSGMAFGFAYVPRGLWLESVAHWDDANNKWLASLFGLSHERILPEKITDDEKGWQEYIDRIWGYLKQGSPVQIIKGWEARIEQGKVFHTGTGMRTYWWEGSAWTSSHYFTVVGMDKSEGIVYINDAAWGWLGSGKYSKLEIETIKKAVQPLPRHLKYVTITFKRTGSQKDENEIERLVRERNIKKLKGDPSVYDTIEMWRAYYMNEKFPGFEHGIKAWRAFRKDLEPAEFRDILQKFVEKKQKPVVVISWMDISVNHLAAATGVSAEYLEESGNMKEWEWLFKYSILLDELRVSTAKLRSIFKSTEDLDKAVELSTPILKDMRQTIVKIINHIERYLSAA